MRMMNEFEAELQSRFDGDVSALKLLEAGGIATLKRKSIRRNKSYYTIVEAYSMDGSFIVGTEIRFRRSPNAVLSHRLYNKASERTQ